MQSRHFRLLLVPLSLVAACSSRPAAHPQAGGAAVWWSPELTLGSLSQLAERRRQPFEEPIEVTHGSEPKTAVMKDCESYEALRAQAFEPTLDQSYAMMLHWGALCRTLDLLPSAKPAADSGMQDLLAARDLLQRLPPLLGPKISPVELERRTKATADGLSWAALSPASVVNEQSQGAAKLTDGDTHTSLELLATGDFDGDGRQDAIVESTSHGDEGNWHEVGLWLLGQPVDPGPARVLRQIEL